MPQSIDGNATDGSELDESNDPTAPLLKSQSSYHTRIVEKIASLLSNWWLWEILGAIICLIAFSMIVLLLAIFDGSSRPDWPSIITACFS